MTQPTPGPGRNPITASEFDATTSNGPKSPMLIFTEAAVNPVRLPADYLEVFANGTFYVVGRPNESHNCDRMGCTSLEHTIARGRLADWQVEDALGLPAGFLSWNDEAVTESAD